VTVTFAEGLAEIFDDLPQDTERLAARSIELLSVYPRMYPVRRRGFMRGYRYFIARRFSLLLFGRRNRNPHDRNHPRRNAIGLKSSAAHRLLAIFK
jgi:hypothetical protein